MTSNVDEQRQHIAALLQEGLGTEAFPRADTHEQVQTIIKKLQLAGNDLKSKLIIAGFTIAPIEHHEIMQSCRSCMYYFIRRRHCVLPELDMPVEPEWSCRLWRI